MTFDPTPIRFNQFVFHDHSYRHPQLGVEVGREFFDRVTERAQALEALTGPGAGCSVLLIAERRMGKTSLLRYLIEWLKAAPGFAPVQLPIGGSLHSADDLFGETVDLLAAALGCRDDDLPADLVGLDVAGQLHVLGQLCAAAPGTTIVLCVDELDACLEHQETPEIERRRIAALVNALAGALDGPSNLPIRLLCTMIRPPERLPGGLAPLLRHARQVHLPPFSRPDLDEMLSELAQAHLGLQLSEDDLALLYRQSGGWPFFAKLLLVSLGKTEAGADRLERAIEAAARYGVVGEAVEHIFRNYFDPNEKALIVELAGEHGSLTAEQIAQDAPQLAAAAGRLTARHFVALDAEGRYEFRIGLLAAWFRQWSKFKEMTETYHAGG